MNQNICYGAIIILFIFVSCSTAEQTVQQPEEPEIPAESENKVPDWFNESRAGYVENNQIYSFGIASAANEDEARKLAIRQSDANLRAQVDYLFEEARIELVENNESDADTPDFIRTLRNTIQKIDLSNADIQIETRKTDTDAVFAYVLKTLTKNKVINNVRIQMQEHKNIDLLLNTEVLN